jgi:hypothetical protein
VGVVIEEQLGSWKDLIFLGMGSIQSICWLKRKIPGIGKHFIGQEEKWCPVINKYKERNLQAFLMSDCCFLCEEERAPAEHSNLCVRCKA